MSSGIDFKVVRETADLRAIISEDIGPASRSGKWLCPFHEDTNPSLGVNHDGRCWRWRCWACGENGDVIDWIAKRHRITPFEAARRLASSFEAPPPQGRREPRPARSESKAKPPAWQDTKWQDAVAGIVRLAEQALWS